VNAQRPISNADPAAVFAPYAGEIREAISRVLASGMFILGPEVEAFEREFADWLGAKHAVGVANGTDALEIALRAAGVGPGDGVIAPANTVSATITAILAIGARPVLTDVDPMTMCLDPVALEKSASATALEGVRAIVPVHLYGHPCDMPAIARIASERGWLVVEDCAQSHGARIGGRMTGTWGVASAFSFYPTKNLGALGDGGAVVTQDQAIATRALELRQYGWKQRYVSEGEGGRNSRLDELQAAVLRVQLRHLEDGNNARCERATIYSGELTASDLDLPAAGGNGVEPVFHQYVVRTPKRDSLLKQLRDEDIAAQVLYPTPIHQQPAFAGLAVAGRLTVCERACSEVLSLPVHPGITVDDARRVVRVVLDCARNNCVP